MRAVALPGRTKPQRLAKLLGDIEVVWDEILNARTERAYLEWSACLPQLHRALAAAQGEPRSMDKIEADIDDAVMRLSLARLVGEANSVRAELRRLGVERDLALSKGGPVSG